MKELERRLTHWERESKNYGLQLNFERTVMLRLLRMEEKTMKVSGSEIKQFERFSYLKSVVEKNLEIQNEINEIIRKASQLYHLIQSIWNKDIDRKCKTTVYIVFFKKILLYGVETWTCTKREESKI
jgi:hypothetical protein